jgi:hypothetical protein
MTAWICQVWNISDPGNSRYFLVDEPDVRMALIEVHKAVNADGDTRIKGLREATPVDLETIGIVTGKVGQIRPDVAAIMGFD